MNEQGAMLISLTRIQRIIVTAGRKTELIGQPANTALRMRAGILFAYMGNLLAHRCFSSLFAGQALSVQQAQFLGALRRKHCELTTILKLPAKPLSRARQALGPSE